MRKLLVVLCFTLLATIVLPNGQAAEANTKFTDVGTTHRAQEEIYYLNDKGIVNGVTSTRFAPDNNVTRAEAAIMLGRAIGIKANKQETSFKDVPRSNGASGYIQAMADKGIINGYPDGDFRPTATLTRGEMAVLITRAFDWGAGSVSASSNKLVSLGIAQGMADGSFGTQHVIKRADFAVFVARSIEPKFRISSTPRPNPTPDQFKTTLYVNSGSAATLNMRKGPGTNHAVITKLKTGTKVLRASTTGSWSYIKVGNQVGYVHSNYLTTDPNPTKPATPGQKKLSDLVVIIDPGHGGHDPGASAYGFKESNMVLNISKKMHAYFEKTPIQSKLTRSTDTFIPLQNRVRFAQQNKGDIFVSVHANSCCGASGQETYYYSRAATAAANPNVQQSKALATYVQNRMLEAWNLPNRGVKNGNFHVLRENTMPSVLAEIGFIDSPRDIQAMKTEAGREKMARALFLGTLDYYYHYESRQDVLPLYNTAGAKPSVRRH